MPEFEVFDKSKTIPRRLATVTVLKSRMLSLNLGAYTQLERPAAVELLYDWTKRIIGLRAVPSGIDHACFVRTPRRSRNGPFLVSAMAFLSYWEVDTGESRRWPAWMEDGVLCISLDDPWELAVGRGQH